MSSAEKGLKRARSQEDGGGEEEDSVACSPSPLLPDPSVACSTKRPRLEEVSPERSHADPDQTNCRADPGEGNDKGLGDDDNKESSDRGNIKRKDDGIGDSKAHLNNSSRADVIWSPRPAAAGGKKVAMVGPMFFESSKAMLDYFYVLLHGWPLLVDVNKYEHLMLEDLLKRGHQEAKQKIGVGIKAFQVRLNRDFVPHCRCFYIIRKDGSVEDFSYRKCVGNILPLPSNLKANASGSKMKKQKDKQRRADDQGHSEECHWGHVGSCNRGRDGRQVVVPEADAD